jgi:release factor glutamine methyltransferase
MPKDEKVWSVLSMLEWATDYFEKKNIPHPRLSIEWLLADTLELRRLDLYLKYDRPLSSGELDELRLKIKRRSRHEPLQYITGFTEFMNCRIDVNPSVLIPRVETEQLVEIILNEHKHLADQPLKVLDIGTGSGCIPIAIARAMPGWHCTGIDSSKDALVTEEENANKNGVAVQFIREDLFNLAGENALSGYRFDLIISNPPYILPGEVEMLAKEVIRFEPRNALVHEDPVTIYNRIGEFASRSLNASGRLYVECNDALAGQISRELQQWFHKVEILIDYDKKERFIKAGKVR